MNEFGAKTAHQENYIFEISANASCIILQCEIMHAVSLWFHVILAHNLAPVSRLKKYKNCKL